MFYGFNAPAYNMMSDTTGVMSLMNASMADSIARNMMYQTNVFGGGIPLNPFAGGCGDFMGLWNMTVAQGFRQGSWGWNPENQTFFPQFCNMGFDNYSYGMGANLMGWQGVPFQTPWQTNSSNNSGSKTETDPDVKKFNKLLEFLKQLDTYVSGSSVKLLTAEQKENLKTLITKTYSEDNYTALKDFYNSLTKSDVLSFIKKGATTLDVSGDVDKINTKGDASNALLTKLQQSGYEYSNTTTDDLIGVLHSELLSITDTQRNTAEMFGKVSGLTHKDDKTTNQPIKPLDIISSWNTKYPKESIIDTFLKGYKKQKDADGKETCKAGLVDFVREFTAQASSVAGNADENTEKAINEAITKLETSVEKMDGNLKSNFNNLYLLLRFASVKQLADDLVRKYSTIDDQVFKSGMFDEDTIADLKAEGFKESEINKAKNASGVTSGSELGTTPDPDNKEDDPTELKYTDDESKELGVKLGNKLFKALDGGNGWSLLGGFDFWGGFGAGYKDGHEKANEKVINKIGKDTNPLTVATMIQTFNEKSGFNEDSDEKSGIMRFIMDEAWHQEEIAVQKISVKVLEMCKALKEKGEWTLSASEKEAYDILQEVAEDKDAIEEYDNDEEIMIDLDKFVAKICDLYSSNF